MFTLGPSRITKEVLLNHTTEEVYMTHYLGIIPGSGLYRSPMRQDNNPTCGFYRNTAGDLIFKDFSDGFSGNFITVVMRLFNVPYYKALNIIANDFGIVNKSHYTKNPAKAEHDGTTVVTKEPTIIQCEIKPYTKEELEWWGGFGVTEKTLKKFKVFSVKNVFLNGVLHSTSNSRDPIYGYYFGKKKGVEQWKIYFPKRRNYRFLLNTNTIQGLAQIPKGCKELLITKSMKDVMTAYELGVTAIAPQAESIVLDKRVIDRLIKFGIEIFITNGDWDRAGQLFMANSRRRYKTICLSFTKKSVYGKDLSDFVELHGIDKAKSLLFKVRETVYSGVLDYQLKYCKSA